MAAFRNAFLLTLLVLLLASTLGALFFIFAHRQTNTASATVPIVGHVYLLSSGRLYVNNNQGINDEVLVDLHNLAAPAAGKSYYGWLLGDVNQSEVPWVALGKVSFNKGTVRYLYAGDQAHTNLLDDMSRFLCDPSVPRRYAVLPGWRVYAAGRFARPATC